MCRCGESSLARRRHGTDVVQALSGGRPGRRSGYLSRERMAELSARLGERLMRWRGGGLYLRDGAFYSPRVAWRIASTSAQKACRPGRMRPSRPPSSRDTTNCSTGDEVVYWPMPLPVPAHGWVRKGDKVALRRTSGRQRLNLHETWRISTALWSRHRCRLHHRLLAKLEASFYVIVDNARYHHARVVRQWLERPDCRITLVFLPAYAPHPTPSRGYGLSCTAK